jgi:gamma-tubulin complex component 3
VNLIHSYTDNGDPFVRHFTDQLLEEVSKDTLKTLVRNLDGRIKVSKPFFSMLRKWLFSGELYDPFSEFFVSIDPTLAHKQFAHPSSLAGGIGQLPGDSGFGADNDDIPGERDSGLKLWEAKYQFEKDMLPMFVGEAFGKKVP